MLILMSLFYNYNVATLAYFIFFSRCCDIVVDVATLSVTCLPYFNSCYSVHACEYKSINIEESQFKHEK